MTKLLNNKYAIAVLVLIALGVFYLRVVGPAMEFLFPEKMEAEVIVWGETDQVYDPEVIVNTEEATERELQFATEQFKLTKIDIRNLRWNEQFGRDPFSASNKLGFTQPTATTIADGSAKFDNYGLPRVSAIVSSPELKFAVIGGEILKEGDLYGNFVLKRIEEEQISMVQRSNNQWHRLSVME